MSVDRDAYIAEVKPGQWKYAVESDWHTGEYLQGGPFNTYSEAVDAMTDRFGNPGFWQVYLNNQHVHEFEEYDEGDVRCITCDKRKEHANQN